MGLKIPFYKICIVGDFGVGKTTLLHQYLERRFAPNVGSTVGSNFFVKYIKIPNNRDIFTLQIWDLAGQEHFKWVRHEFYKGAKGIVYVFDLTRKKTFENISNWKEEIKKALGNFSSVLVGNKLDLKEDRVVLTKEGETLSQKLKLSYVETSAKTGENIDDAFQTLALQMIKRFVFTEEV